MIAYLDCTSGISGDKFLGALVDAGAPEEAVRSALAAIDPSITVTFADVIRAGVRGRTVAVTATHEPSARSWDSVRALIERANLDEVVRETSLAAFSLLADAEATVHGVAPDDVHFHEVGALDSIADVVGTATALHALGIERLVCGPVAVGSGTIETAHGTLPVPAPATALLLSGVPIEAGLAPGEATTPTGAALVRACASEFGPVPAMTLEAVGHGAGTRDVPGVPNVARVMLGSRPDSAGPGLQEEAVTELVTAIDHLSAEQLAFCCEELRAAGALDVWQAPVVMKKGRLGTSVTALCSPHDAARLARLVADATGTLGVRVRPMTRYVSARELRVVETSFGPVHVKAADMETVRRVRVEYEDVAEIARREQLPIDVVSRRLEAEIDASQADGPP